MHRQSLGSPSPKQLMNMSDGEIQSANSSYEEEEEEEELKKIRPRANETYIHLIPMLTLLCFLILYLSSHRPSQNDLAQFNVSKAFSNPASEMEEIKRGGDVVAIRSLMNLEGRSKHQRLLHRKIPHS